MIDGWGRLTKVSGDRTDVITGSCAGVHGDELGKCNDRGEFKKQKDWRDCMQSANKERLFDFISRAMLPSGAGTSLQFDELRGREFITLLGGAATAA